MYTNKKVVAVKVHFINRHTLIRYNYSDSRDHI